MAIDPFADAPTNNGITTTNNEQKVVNVGDQSNAHLSVTLKAGEGYNVPWIVVHGNTPGELLEILKDDDMQELISRTAMTNVYFAGVHDKTREEERKSTAPKQQQSQPAQESTPDEDAPNCSHGKRQWHKWNRKSDGKLFKGYFCPMQDRAQKCDPDWR